jgi:hypothetical protein
MPAERQVPSAGDPGAMEPGLAAAAMPAAETMPAAQATATAGHRSLLHSWLVAFGQFWWDFLVGDTPELLVGVLVALGVVALLVKGAGLNAVAVVAFPIMVAVMLGLSVHRARPRR